VTTPSSTDRDVAGLARTPLYAEHVALGARLAPFAGWSMPVQYAGVLKEHAAVRNHAGLFDLSHMAQFALDGAGVAAWADGLTVNRVRTMPIGGARYNLFCDERGGVLDDVLFYRLADDRFLLVVNAANARKMCAYLHERAAGLPDVSVRDLRAERALIAVQGPRAVELVAPFCDREIRGLRYYACAEYRIDGVAALVARTGYTGEDGVELFVPAAAAPRLWRMLLAAGASAGLVPCGLGARDVLRLEAGMPLYGRELGPEISPIAADLGRTVAFEKPAFCGKEALLAEVARRGPRIVGLRLEGRIPARGGYAVYAGAADADARVGEVLSASVAPSLGNAQIATALVPQVVGALGARLFVEVRGTRQPARVVSLPFYRRPSR